MSEQSNFSAKTPEELKQERMIENLLQDDMKVFIQYLEDDSVTDMAVTDSGELIVTYFGKGRVFTGIDVPSYIVERILKATAAILGKSIDFNSRFPVLEGVIPKYNARVTGLTRHNCCRYELQIRKPAKLIYTLEDYVESKRMTQEQYDEVVKTIKDRGNIIISGSTGSGKTTMTNAVIKKMSEFTPDDNFYIIEDTPDLQCDAKMKTILEIHNREHFDILLALHGHACFDPCCASVGVIVPSILGFVDRVGAVRVSFQQFAPRPRPRKIGQAVFLLRVSVDVHGIQCFKYAHLL